jgi:hypothetical protein
MGAALVVLIGSLVGFYVYGRVAEKQAIRVDTTQSIRE